jgi:hypothetical protein
VESCDFLRAILNPKRGVEHYMPKTKSTNKSAFVRGLSGDMSAKDVVAKAKAAGITLTENYVYTIRSAAKNKSKKGTGRGPGRPKGSKSASVSLSSNGSLEKNFVESALELGLGNAEKLLARLRARIRSVALG